VIASGQTESNAFLASRDFRDADSITIWGPDTLPESVTVHVADNEAPAASDYAALSRGGADVTIPANKAITVELPSFRAMKLVAGAAVGAERRFKVNKGFFA
jgi:hypothetical protein